MVNFPQLLLIKEQSANPLETGGLLFLSGGITGGIYHTFRNRWPFGFGLTLYFSCEGEKRISSPATAGSGAVAALTFASPGLLRRYLRAEANGTPGPPLGS